MHHNFLEKIGNKIGLIEELDSGENGNFLGSFTRVRVKIDIRHAIKGLSGLKWVERKTT